MIMLISLPQILSNEKVNKNVRTYAIHPETSKPYHSVTVICRLRLQNTVGGFDSA